MRTLLIASFCVSLLGSAAHAQEPPPDPAAVLENARGTIDHYRKLLADPALDPVTRANVERELAILRAQLEPAPRLQLPEPSMRPQYHYEWRRDRGMIAGGISLLATAYMGAVITGSIYLDINDRNANSMYAQPNTPNSAAAGTLLIPVLGPIISAFCYLHASWALPWLLVDAAAQVGGLTMTIVGARTKHKVAVLDKLVITPYAVPEGGGLKISGRF